MITFRTSGAERAISLPCLLFLMGLVVTLALPGCGGNGDDDEPDGGQSGTVDDGAAPTTSSGAVAVDDATLVRKRNLALAYIEAELHVEAAAAFDELIALLPNEPMVHANRGLIDLRDNRLAEARAHLKTAADLAPNDPDIAILRALALAETGSGEAVTVLREALESNPNHARLRYALIEALGRDPETAGEEREQLTATLELIPRNIVVRLALIRALIEANEPAAALEHLNELDRQGVVNTDQTRELLERGRSALEAGDAAGARSPIVQLANVLKQTRPWKVSVNELRAPPGLIADPIRRFLVHRVEEPHIGPRPLEQLRFVETREAHESTIAAAADGSMPIFIARSAVPLNELIEPVPAPADGASQLTALDWNNDRRMDIVSWLDDGAVVLHLRGEDGRLPDAGMTLAPGGGHAVEFMLPWDVEADGDLDLLVGRRDAPPSLLRNNGDDTVTEIAVELGFADAGASWVDAEYGDVDEDGDLDLLAVTSTGSIVLYENRRSGVFVPIDFPPTATPARSILVVDFGNDGWLDVLTVDANGRCDLFTNNEGSFAAPTQVLPDIGENIASIDPIDFDNDGWLDVMIVADGRPHLYRNVGSTSFAAAEADEKILPEGEISTAQVIDCDGDGDQDLFVRLADGQVEVWDNDGGNAHGSLRIELESVVQGDQRNNSYAVGATIEVRAGDAYQKRVVRGPVTHFGMGEFGPADAVRIIWPNGVPQIIIQPQPNQRLTEVQSLKGSCPFLLADNGEELAFVTDLLWRSPLGMRINAQTIAPIATTKDYVRIEADQLVARDGRYDLAMTASLWETIFVDEAELWAVDHPPSVEVFVDERFIAPELPPFEIHVVDEVRVPVSATDHRGRDVLPIIAVRDRERLGGFAKTRYQGLAEMHYVELDLGAWDESETIKLIASGWIMPTDTSLNVAIGQSSHTPPMPLQVLLADGAGGWTPVMANAGFPAGKLKTIVLDLTGLFPSSDHRVRLQTNMEIYWDRIGYALGEPSFSATPITLNMVKAELYEAGFPSMSRKDDLAPELPDYSAVTRQPRWRDLHGYYTRFGDVWELLESTDDRYVIMNAGDGIRFAFETGSPPPDGWVRDFIFFSDGWVKDGDFNTAESKTVGPLPYHTMDVYPVPTTPIPASLSSDHPDWLEYHTRYIDSTPFRDRMRPR